MGCLINSVPMILYAFLSLAAMIADNGFEKIIKERHKHKVSNPYENFHTKFLKKFCDVTKLKIDQFPKLQFSKIAILQN